jgi:hypothetical protein
MIVRQMIEIIGKSQGAFFYSGGRSGRVRFSAAAGRLRGAF